MSLSLLHHEDLNQNTGLTPVPRHFTNGGLKESGDRESPTLDKTLSRLFPGNMLARQMLGLGGLALHATLATSPNVYAPPWYANPSSPPPTPVAMSKRTSSDVVTSTSSTRRRKRVRTSPVVEIPPEPPLSPPTSGSSPQSNGSGQEMKVNDKDKLFTCGICQRSFGYKHVLQNHERTHTGEKPFECVECHKRFTRDHHLKTHMRLHTGEKPYHCTHCDRQFVQVANLRRHLRVHTGERPYACELCSSKFSDSNQLKAHMLIHNGEKPFPCTLCNSKFRRRHHLMHHKCPNKNFEGELEDESIDDEESLETNSLEIDEDADSNPSSPDYSYPPELYAYSINNNRKVRERKSRDIRRVVRQPDPPMERLAVPALLPEQTEPEDLSMPKSKLRAQLTQNNNEVVDKRQYYREVSPTQRLKDDTREALTSLYHPKFRRHVEMKHQSSLS